MNISISDKDCFYEYLKELGFYGLDVPFDSFSKRDFILSDEYYGFIMEKYKKITEAGLVVAQTHLTYYLGENGGYTEFEESMLPILVKEIGLTKELNCKVCVLHLYIGENLEESRKANVQLISKLLPVAEENNVTIAIENTYNGECYGDSYIDTYENFMFYMDYFKNPNLGICLDSGHAIIRKQDPVELFKKLEKYIVALHLHTTTENIDMHAIPLTLPYGEKIRWNEFYKLIEASSYKGTFNLELRPSSRLNDKAKKAYYMLAYETVQTIIYECGSNDL